MLLPPLHFKLRLMKRLFKALPKDGEFFNYFCEQFSSLSKEILKEGVPFELDFRKLMKGEIFETKMKIKDKHENFRK